MRELVIRLKKLYVSKEVTNVDTCGALKTKYMVLRECTQEMRASTESVYTGSAGGQGELPWEGEVQGEIQSLERS